MVGKLFEDTRFSSFVDLCEIASRYVLAKAKMIGLIGMRRNNTGQITKAVTVAQLPEHHDEQLVPACEMLHVFVPFVFHYNPIKDSLWQELYELSEDIVTINGGTWIISKRHKTQIPFQVKLLNIPLEIIKRYHQDGQTIFPPPMEYRTMAKRIHRVMDECGFRKHITLHCARHTFAVLALTKGVPIESVSRILGHTNITTTQIYAKITMQKLDNDLTAFEQSLHLINNI